MESLSVKLVFEVLTIFLSEKMAIKYFVFPLIIGFVLISNGNSAKNRRSNNFVSESVSHEQGIQKFYSSIIVHNHIKETCGAPEYKKELKKNLKMFMCQPMDTVVHLYSKHANMMMLPDKVVVKRCYETGCYGRNSCVANNTREISLAVRFISSIPQRNQKKCGWVKVIEHVQCTCGCKLSRQECEQNGKIFNAQDCTCRCPDETILKAECKKQNDYKMIKGKRMEWNEETCSCQNKILCTTDD